MREPFKNFKLDDSSLIHASERATNIRITGLYEEGVGYVVNKKDYERDVYPKLEEAGYEIHFSKKSGVSPTLTHPGANKMRLYMHPEGYTGYATEGDIYVIKRILDSCPLIRETDILYEKKVYDLDDFNYKYFLIKNTNRIIEEIKSFLDKGDFVHSSDIGFDFARNVRIPRVGDKTGIYADDVDVLTVEDIFLTAVYMGKFDEYRVVIEGMNTAMVDGRERQRQESTKTAGTQKIPFEEFVPASEKINKEETAVVPGFGRISMDIYISADQTGLSGTQQRYDCVLSSNVSKPPIVFSCVKDITQGDPDLIYCFGRLMAKAKADMVTGIEKEDLQRFFGAVALEEMINEATQEMFQEFLTEYTVCDEPVEEEVDR